ncbi:MAG: ATPase domain-containing protein [archaeon]|nr:ATPase domain-containing protein [archaeon]
METWENFPLDLLVLDLLKSLIYSTIGTFLGFILLRAKLTEKIQFIEDNQDKIKGLIIIFSMASLISVFLFYFTQLNILLLGFVISILISSTAYLSINYTPIEYIKTKIREYSSENIKEFRKVITNIQWKFDKVLGGGLPSGHICLITGPPGIGITILSYEILYNGFKISSENGLFVSMNEYRLQLINRLNAIWRETDKISGIQIEEVKGDSPPYPHINWKRLSKQKVPLFSWEAPIYVILGNMKRLKKT